MDATAFFVGRSVGRSVRAELFFGCGQHFF